MVDKSQLASIVSGGPDNLSVVLFDLDGTLVDSAPDICLSINDVMDRYGLPFVAEKYVRNWVGLGTRSLLRNIFNGYVDFRGGTISKDDFVCAYNLFLSSYRTTNGKSASLYPGARDILVELTNRNFRIGIVTNRPAEFADTIVSHFGLNDLVEIVLCADQFGSYKPEPNMLLYAVSELGGVPELSIMVGDSFSDVMAAKNAGMMSVYVRYGYRSNAVMCELHADRAIDSLLELV